MQASITGRPRVVYGPTRLSTTFARDAISTSAAGSPTSAATVAAGAAPTSAMVRSSFAASRPAAPQLAPTSER